MFFDAQEAPMWFQFVSRASLVLGIVFFVKTAYDLESGRHFTPTSKSTLPSLVFMIAFAVFAPSEGSRIWTKLVDHIGEQQEWQKIVFRAITSIGLVYLGQVTYYSARYKSMPPFTSRKRLFSMIALTAAIFLIGLTLHFRFERARPHAHFWN